MFAGLCFTLIGRIDQVSTFAVAASGAVSEMIEEGLSGREAARPGKETTRRLVQASPASRLGQVRSRCL